MTIFLNLVEYCDMLNDSKCVFIDKFNLFTSVVTHTLWCRLPREYTTSFSGIDAKLRTLQKLARKLSLSPQYVYDTLGCYFKYYGYSGGTRPNVHTNHHGHSLRNAAKFAAQSDLALRKRQTCSSACSLKLNSFFSK